MRLRVPASVRGMAIVPVTVAFFISTAAQAQSVYSTIADGPLFPHWRAQVERMVATGDKPVNHVCIVGWREKNDADVQQAYVIWPEQHRLITWLPSSDPNSLLSETHVLDLTKDVVANENLVGGSSYLVTQAWVRNIEHQCRAFGTELLIRRGKG